MSNYYDFNSDNNNNELSHYPVFSEGSASSPILTKAFQAQQKQKEKPCKTDWFPDSECCSVRLCGGWFFSGSKPYLHSQFFISLCKNSFRQQ